MQTTPAPRSSPFKCIAILCFPLLFFLLIILHTRHINGPSYWFWHYRHLPVWPLAGMMLAAALPFAVAHLLYAKELLSPRVTLLFVALTTVLLRYAAVVNTISPPSLDVVNKVVTHPVAYSYYRDALRVLTDVRANRLTWPRFLQLFPTLMPNLGMHTRIRAPGGILLHAALISLFGQTYSPAITGLFLALAAGASLFAVYWMLRVFDFSPDASLAAASVIALCPGFILFFPMLDPTYVGATALLIAAWQSSLRAKTRRDTILWAALFATILFLATLITYNLLVLGLFIGALALLHLRRQHPSPSPTFQACLTVILLFVGLYTLLYLTTGFDPIATFGSALANQRRNEVVLGRNHFHTQLWDLYDFSFASAHLAIPLAIAGLFSSRNRAISVLALATIAIIDLAALLPAETARVWLFLLPLLVIPIAAVLPTWPPRLRAALYTTLFLATFLVCQNIWFITFSESLLPPWSRTPKLTGPHAHIILPPPGADE